MGQHFNLMFQLHTPSEVQAYKHLHRGLQNTTATHAPTFKTGKLWDTPNHMCLETHDKSPQWKDRDRKLSKFMVDYYKGRWPCPFVDGLFPNRTSKKILRLQLSGIPSSLIWAKSSPYRLVTLCFFVCLSWWELGIQVSHYQCVKINIGIKL